jgi:S-adenosylmethionine:tRNA ribosyltransferase-isomerase
LKTSDFDYELPSSYIAQTPIEPRDSSRLMVYHRRSGCIEHSIFSELPGYLSSGDVLVVNQTRVMKSRLTAKKIPSGGKFEILLLKKQTDLNWIVLVGGKGIKLGQKFRVDVGHEGEITGILNGAQRLVKFDKSIDDSLELIGSLPLPPYIHEELGDPERYQTIFSHLIGSSAAPTAGLHFTPELIEKCLNKGVKIAPITLHVGLDTFAPIREETPENHRIHTEWCNLDQRTSELINQAKHRGNRIFAVGTTSVRTLETAAILNKSVFETQPYVGPTNLFIIPGYKFRIVDSLITNFHLPRSTLILMMSSFVGREKLLTLYQLAKAMHYRFYSFGDAMMVV